MTYEESINYLYTHQWLGAVYGLDTMTELLRRLDHPEQTLTIIHIAGTNGKGSTTAGLASVLIASGHRVVSYTSPEVHTYLDRFRIGREAVSDVQFAACLTRVAALADAMAEDGHPHPTVFEMELAVSLLIAVAVQPDFYLMETGMGGRLDATNAIKNPRLTIITTIALDHQQYLGDDLLSIAQEKAGIVKSGVPLLTWPHEAPVSAVLRKRAQNCGAPYCEIEADAIHPGPIEDGLQTFHYRGQLWMTTLLGPHQCENAAGVIEAALLLRGMGYMINNAHIAAGLRSIDWPGRFEQIARRPDVYLDGAHNPEATAALMATLGTVLGGRVPTFILHVFADKDVEGIVHNITTPAKEVICTSVNHPRSLAPDALAAIVRAEHPTLLVSTAASLNAAVQKTMVQSQPEDIIVIFGSLSHLEAARTAIREFTGEDNQHDQL